MPQMNPIWWTSLFIMFILSLLATNSLNYFFKNNSFNKSINKNFSYKNLAWKW